MCCERDQRDASERVASRLPRADIHDRSQRVASEICERKQRPAEDFQPARDWHVVLSLMLSVARKNQQNGGERQERRCDTYGVSSIHAHHRERAPRQGIGSQISQVLSLHYRIFAWRLRATSTGASLPSEGAAARNRVSWGHVSHSLPVSQSHTL